MKGIPREVELEEKHKVTNSSRIRILRNNFLLSPYQKSVLTGTLLGDGSLFSDGWSKNYRLQIVQGDIQKDYLFWKFEVFRNCCSSEPSYQEGNRSWRIRTISHVEFNPYAEIFYRNNKKVIIPDILEKLEPLSLAIWFMDDGSFRDTGYILNTQSFTYEENQCLRMCLINKFFLEDVSIQKDRKWWRLYIYKNSKEKFRELVRPYIIPSMIYKLHILTP